MSTKVRVLLVDAKPGGAALLNKLLRRSFEVLVASNAPEALANLKANTDISVVLVSHGDDQLDAIALLQTCSDLYPETRRVLLTESENPQLFRQAINEAQIEHIARRPIDSASLLPALEALVEGFRKQQEDRRLPFASASETGERDGGLANKDRLTGLYNHRFFQERFREEISRAQRDSQCISILYVDIDNFSSLNRGIGFQCGDEVLQNFARILQSGDDNARAANIVSRFGGQEFVILLPETDKMGAGIKAERLRESISASSLPGGVSVTVSIGVASFPSDASSAAEVLGEATKALRMAKERGRNQVVLCGQDQELARNLDIPNTHTEVFPTFHDRMGDLVYALERDRRMSCLYVDLSRLRRIEREFGIAQHNQLLARAGQLLSGMRGSGLRRDDLLCRSDDADGFFCFLSPPRKQDTAPLDLRDMIARLSASLNEGLAEAMRGLTRDQPQITVGMGRVLSNPMIRGERLVHRLVEESKHAANLEWQRQSKIHKVELQELIIQRGLRTAYQPLVDLDTGDVFAFEALTRGPVDSLLASPAALFSVADAVDLTLELDRACFSEALRNATGCKPIHHLFLNLLPASFYDAHFIEVQVVKMLEDVGLTPANLVFEITERLAIENFPAFRQALSRYTDMGFGVAIDDVGTRHSNLEAVMALQPHFIKLSEILCRGVTTSTVKREMVRSLVRIATAIDAVTVAEGIEDLEDLMTLRDLGVRFGQGYFLARPDFCFPIVSEEALSALAGRPQRLRPSDAVAATQFTFSSVGDDDATGQIMRVPVARERDDTDTARSQASSDEAFEDEPTRTRGSIN